MDIKVDKIEIGNILTRSYPGRGFIETLELFKEDIVKGMHCFFFCKFV